jgi:hypothetical protein
MNQFYEQVDKLLVPTVKDILNNLQMGYFYIKNRVCNGGETSNLVSFNQFLHHHGNQSIRSPNFRPYY